MSISSKQATSGGQYMTFYVGEDLYGIEVMEIQEVTGHLPVEEVPLAPDFVRGLINLRGQIATALDLKKLFGLGKNEVSKEKTVSVVCKLDGNLISLLVDRLGDVVESNQTDYESAPETIPAGVRKYIQGIGKRKDGLLSIIDLEKLSKEVNYNLDLKETVQ